MHCSVPLNVSSLSKRRADSIRIMTLTRVFAWFNFYSTCCVHFRFIVESLIEPRCFRAQVRRNAIVSFAAGHSTWNQFIWREWRAPVCQNHLIWIIVADSWSSIECLIQSRNAVDRKWIIWVYNGWWRKLFRIEFEWLRCDARIE